MKFHYKKQLIIVLVVAVLIWISQPIYLYLKIDPVTLARSNIRDVSEHLSAARAQLDVGVSQFPAGSPAWLRDARDHVAYATVKADDQTRLLQVLDKERSSLDRDSIQPLIASLVAIFGTLSTVVLSWRKDMREAKAEIEKARDKEPRIIIR
ncbi:hypothetical protein KP003_07675 [Geomonas nitrogeniifigens]|uniref:Uncharacterized protein n=1 Tax=Geomonas diazotrophica TaxID=2843197 RepID=A0ABX8JPT9_9BACT|nr:hypothetical protein [Geomonas nitrogeniifigens]QWV99101.1 hypothetical protein KP005_07420 [Geomonas nitrogeniifigens]QXE88269.1 hypothetical protein KP003_07675 [Geomonas nitrogeniifigens]